MKPKEWDRYGVLIKRMIVVLIVMINLFLIGTLGYELIEGWGPFESFYMTIITIFTVGFEEVYPLSRAGRLFTIFLIWGGAGILAITMGVFTSFFVENDINALIKRRRLMKKLSKMKDHAIICGGGRTGRVVAQYFYKVKRPFVVIEKDEEKVSLLKEEMPGILILEEDIKREGVLEMANIKDASILIVALSDEIDNLFVVISGRALNPDIYIIAKSFTKEVTERMLIAGANHVVNPHRICGEKMASLAFSML